MAVWDEQVFRARALECGQRVGLTSLRKIAIAAGLDPKLFRDDIEPPEGRNIKTIFQVADAVKADPAYLMGLTNSPDGITTGSDSSLRPTELDGLAYVATLAAHLYVAAGGRPRPPAGDARRAIEKLLATLDTL